MHLARNSDSLLQLTSNKFIINQLLDEREREIVYRDIRSLIDDKLVASCVHVSLKLHGKDF
jgi:hypothetical protein